MDDALAHELERRFGAGEFVGGRGADHDGEGALFRAVDACRCDARGAKEAKERGEAQEEEKSARRDERWFL